MLVLSIMICIACGAWLRDRSCTAQDAVDVVLGVSSANLTRSIFALRESRWRA